MRAQNSFNEQKFSTAKKMQHEAPRTAAAATTAKACWIFWKTEVLIMATEPYIAGKLWKKVLRVYTSSINFKKYFPRLKSAKDIEEITKYWIDH